MANSTSTSPKKSTSVDAATSKVAEAAETTSKTVKNTAKTLASDAESAAKAGLDRVKDAIPSLEGVAGSVQDYVHDHTNVDLQKMANDANGFVRRNPGVSIAAAVGLGVLIGVAIRKRY